MAQVAGIIVGNGGALMDRERFRQLAPILGPVDLLCEVDHPSSEPQGTLSPRRISIQQSSIFLHVRPTARTVDHDLGRSTLQVHMGLEGLDRRTGQLSCALQVSVVCVERSTAGVLGIGKALTAAAVQDLYGGPVDPPEQLGHDAAL